MGIPETAYFKGGNDALDVLIKGIAPLDQNPVSGECGVLSILNAFRSLHPKYRGTNYEDMKPLEEMYSAILRRISDPKQFLREGSNSIRTLIEEAIRYARIHHGIKFSFTEHVNCAKVESPHAKLVWIVGLEDHWSVILYISKAYVRFYDSYAPERLVMEAPEDVDIGRMYAIQLVD